MASYPASATATAVGSRLPAISTESAISARAWNPVSVGPGHRAVTVTPVPFSSSRRASESESTYAFVAAYAAVIGAGENEPIDPRFSTRPHPRSIIPGRHRRVSSVSVSMLTRSMSIVASRSVSTSGP